LRDKFEQARQSMPMFDLGIEAGVARLTLNRPEARHAIPAAGWSALEAAAEEAERAGARVLLLQGQGDAFCAGADITEFRTMRGNTAAAARFRGAMRSALDRLRRLALVTVAVVDGPCYGAGVALAMTCDLRLAGARSRFAITPARFGLCYPQEDVARLVSLVGPAQAARLLFGAASIDGAEAARIGLVELHLPTGLAEAVEELVDSVLDNSGDSLVTLKRAIALAAAGVAADEEQDRRFDALLAGDEVADRLRERRGGR
jgi:enoyl-CoA hydratase/carnithine racemase